ncbi:hypothetical protein [Brevundimonas naejangsanensis]|nr:hypothetical protein [Brevundimonas naejangsanensis]
MGKWIHDAMAHRGETIMDGQVRFAIKQSPSHIFSIRKRSRILAA